MLRSVIPWLLFVLVGLGGALPTADLKVPTPAPKQKKVSLVLPKTIRKPFVPYVKMFIRTGRKYHKKLVAWNLIIKFGPTEEIKQKKEGYKTVGYCQGKQGDVQKIIINKEFWGMYSEAKRELLMMHELGHCLLNLDHNDSLDAEKQPVTIMNSIIFSDYQYSDHRDYYLKELFSH